MKFSCFKYSFGFGSVFILTHTKMFLRRCSTFLGLCLALLRKKLYMKLLISLKTIFHLSKFFFSPEVKWNMTSNKNGTHYLLLQTT